MARRMRLLPIVIAVAAIALALRLANIWLGVNGDVTSPAIAEAKQNDDDAKSAKDDPEGTDKAEKAPKEKDEKVKPAAVGPFDPTTLTDDELRILQKLRARRAEIEKRERELSDRAKLLKAAETRIEARIAELAKVKQEIEKLLKKHDAQEEAKLKSLVKIYENMKPKDAARIFEKLDMPILLQVIERMREAKSAPIMAKMEPGKAKSLTTALATRRALPTERKPESR